MSRGDGCAEGARRAWFEGPDVAGRARDALEGPASVGAGLVRRPWEFLVLRSLVFWGGGGGGACASTAGFLALDAAGFLPFFLEGGAFFAFAFTFLPMALGAVFFFVLVALDCWNGGSGE